MKTFYCDACGALVFFENVTCLACGHALGFIAEPDVLDLSAVEPAPHAQLRALAAPVRDRHYRVCANGRDHAVCNWLVAAEDGSAFCVACRLNDVIPDLSMSGNRELWHRLELAKRRLVYALLKLKLPTEAAPEEGRRALRFRFLDATSDGMQPMTGHADGVITIALAEADDAVREQRRVSLHEPFRTLLGHFRHEVAHYYWDRLIAGSAWLEPFRERFGDERADYAAALEKYYRDGPPADWSMRHVSAYASVHPWEDWAETAAHLFHILDTIETAAGFGVALQPRHPAAETMTTDTRRAARPSAGFDVMLETWFPLTYALNSLNRGMGLPDLYPFVLPPPAIEKLRFAYDVLTLSAPRQ